MKQKLHRDAPVLFLAALLTPALAHAYIDPGFGALVWQAAFAAIVGAAFFLRSTIAASVRWARNKISGAPAAPAPTEPAAPSERPTEPG